MNFQLTTAGGEGLVFHPLLPPDLSAYQVFPTVFAASGDWGTIIFQVMQTDEFSIWYCNFLIKEDSSFLIEANGETIQFYMVVRSDFAFDVQDFEKIYVRENQFNMTYLPVVKMNIHFKAGEYATFDISVSKKYLTRFHPYLPALQNLLQHVEAKSFCHLIPAPAYATPGMKEVFNDILKHEFNNGISRIYLESKVLELLSLAIRKIGTENKRQLTLNAADIVNIEKIKGWLDKHVDDPGSLHELASRFSINEYKLRKGFRVLYDTTVFDYLLGLRLQNARAMLLETNKKITEIAYLTGYTSNSHFTNAFKKHFGYPPIYLRKSKG